ncbi:hypothetical protein SEEA9225_21654 [Salmonella enterica subsp. enterica serovar Agona str. 442692 2-5]|nr:hypothetical protein SEEA9225_21654 [Salmonella enterica subsp. enterica serovar Agona str. 442692 2-5]
MATSPVKGVWTVYQCQHCLYTWRDTEPLRRTSREHYPQAFRMTQKDIDDAPMVPSIPPLLAEDNGKKKASLSTGLFLTRVLTRGTALRYSAPASAEFRADGAGLQPESDEHVHA